MQTSNSSKSTQATTYCCLPRRLLAILYDGIVLLGLLIIASAIALPFGSMNKTAFHDLWFTLWLLVVCFAYLGTCWRYGGMTVGMRAWKIRLTGDEGQAVTWTTCLVRFFAGLVSLSALGLGVFWALVDKKNRGWHDLASHTLLIRSD